MTEKERMEHFFDNYDGEGAIVFRAFMTWDKSGRGDYSSPFAKLLWAAWQAAQYGQSRPVQDGQTSFDFIFEPPKSAFGEK